MLARATATAASTAQRLVALGQNSGTGNGDRESVASEENMSISGNQRYMVMQSLARSGGILPPSPAVASSSGVGESNVVRLQYDATPADVDDQLEEEFKEECSNYGPVLRVQLMPLNPAEGLLRIFIQFVSPVGKFLCSMLCILALVVVLKTMLRREFPFSTKSDVNSMALIRCTVGSCTAKRKTL